MLLALGGAAPAWAGMVATGGNTTDELGDGAIYRTHVFTNSGSLVVSSGGNVEALVVAGGGGGGGGAMSGGGGAGGVIVTSNLAVATGTYAVTIGAGGLGGYAHGQNNQAGLKGTNSSLGALLVAIGGGGGAGWNNPGVASSSGGSGGGGNANNAASAGTAGQGYAGDTGYATSPNRSGGGGGGAGEAGHAGTAGVGGSGGSGILFYGKYYGGGGGGGLEGTPLSANGGGPGGLGGGGAGSKGTTKAVNAVANTGGGGGGAGYNTSGSVRLGGNGGSGIVIVRYPYSALAVLDEAKELVGPGQWSDLGLQTTNLYSEYTFTITNASASAVELSGATPVTVSAGDVATFSIAQQPGLSEIPPYGATTFKVRYQPLDLGITTAQIAVAHSDASPSPYTFNAQCRGISGAQIGVLGPGANELVSSAPPSTLNGTDFGTRYTDAPDIERHFVITNHSAVAHLALESMVLTGAGADQFELVTNQWAASLAPGAALPFSVRLIGTTPGLHNAQVIITNNTYGLEQFAINIRSRCETAIYVSASGNDSSNGLSWAAAKATIGGALTPTPNYATVFVTNGTYSITSPINVISNIIIRSINGPDVTRVQRGSGQIRIFSLSHAGAQLHGLTIANGLTSGDGVHGLGLNMSAGLVSNCVVSGNTASRGSALYMSGGTFTHGLVINNTDNGNDSSCGGAQIGGNAVIEWTIFSGNLPGWENHSVSALRLAGAGQVRNCIFTNQNSRANINHRVVSITAAGALLQNCLIADNPGRGVVLGANSTVENCTIAKNTIYDNSINGLSMSTGTVRNTIIWNNGNDINKNFSKSGGVTEFNDIPVATAGNGNLSSDPLFVDADNGDYRLQAASPLINAGTNLDWQVTGLDLDGKARRSGSATDMGCFEAEEDENEPLACSFDGDKTEGFADFTVSYSSMAIGGNTDLTFRKWDFGDGHQAIDLQAASIDHTYTTPGLYTVSLVVSNTIGEGASMVKQDYIYVVPAVIHVSPQGANALPYQDWANAANSVSAALDAARVINGQATLILISNGTYKLSSTLQVDKGVSMRSVNGWEVTRITREPAAKHIANISHANAVIDGLDIYGGIAAGESKVGGVNLYAGAIINSAITANQGYRAAGGIVMSGGLVSNTVFSGNYDIGNFFETTGALIMTGGLVTDCDFVGNYGGNLNNAVGGIKMSGGTVQNSRIVGNYYDYAATASAGGVEISSGTLRNCLIGGNKDRGIAQSGGTVENCTIVRNGGVGINFSSGTLANTISCFNGGSNKSGSGSDFRNLCVPGIDPNDGNGGNVAADPQFKNSGSGSGVTWTEGDYRLLSTSPCVNGGFNQVWMETARDLAGEGRIRGSKVDIGAYEAQHFLSTVLLLK